MSRKLQKIMSSSKKDEKEIKLREYAKELGCSLQGTYTASGIHLEQEIIRRIMEAEKCLNQGNLFEFKPNFFGFGIDLKKLWNLIRSKWRGRDV